MVDERQDCGAQQIIGMDGELIKYCVVNPKTYSSSPWLERCKYQGEMITLPPDKLELDLTLRKHYLCKKRIPAIHESLGGISNELGNITKIVSESIDEATKLLENKVQEE